MPVHSIDRRNIMDSHSSAGGTDAAKEMAGAPEPGGAGRAVAAVAPGRIAAGDRPRPRSPPQGGAPDPGGDGGLHPVARRRSPRVLSLAEREEISRGVAGGHSEGQIAGQLGRAPSTVCRELGRHGGRAHYRAATADAAAPPAASSPRCARRRRPRERPPSARRRATSARGRHGAPVSTR